MPEIIGVFGRVCPPRHIRLIAVRWFRFENLRLAPLTDTQDVLFITFSANNLRASHNL